MEPEDADAVVLVPDPLDDWSHVPAARWRRAADSASGKSGAYCSMSFGIWCWASRSDCSECAHWSICPSDW